MLVEQEPGATWQVIKLPGCPPSWQGEGGDPLSFQAPLQSRAPSTAGQEHLGVHGAHCVDDK